MYKKQAELFKALSDENRLKILELLIAGETCGCTLIDKLPISQPTLSYHLKILTEAGITKAKKDGVWMKYTVNKEVLQELVSFLDSIQKSTSVCKL
mgnify:CR=1 FL=1